MARRSSTILVVAILAVASWPSWISCLFRLPVFSESNLMIMVFENSWYILKLDEISKMLFQASLCSTYAEERFRIIKKASACAFRHALFHLYAGMFRANLEPILVGQCHCESSWSLPNKLSEFDYIWRHNSLRGSTIQFKHIQTALFFMHTLSESRVVPWSWTLFSFSHRFWMVLEFLCFVGFDSTKIRCLVPHSRGILWLCLCGTKQRQQRQRCGARRPSSTAGPSGSCAAGCGRGSVILNVHAQGQDERSCTMTARSKA